MSTPDAKQSDAQRFYDALKRITRYQSAERLAATSEKQYGLEPQEALEMAYDNIQGEARAALHGKRRPKQ
jgi:hypothetical protein